LRNFQDESLAFGGSSGELHPAFAQHVDSARRLTFHKQHRTRGIGRGIFDPVERFQRGLGQRAKETVATEFADYTIFNQLKP